MPVGQEIVTFCTKCKLELRHVIVAHKNGNAGAIAKVKCNTCTTIHAFRNKPTEKSVAAAAARKAAGPRVKAEVIPIEVEWRTEMDKLQKQKVIPYSTSGAFKVGDVLEHPNFGAGIVRVLKDGNKLEVMFERDMKVLIHQR